jgi:hypothetical protein
MKPKTPAAGSHSDLDKFVDDLDDLSILGSVTRTKEESASSMTWTLYSNNLPWVGFVPI